MADPLFGIHAISLHVQRQRMELLAGNIANADTPGYKARDLDFQAALTQAMAGSGGATANPASLYRIPMQPSVDGNTVDVQTEQAAFMDASMHYQASLSFLDGRLKSLLTAITGD
ncbi:MAG: flagellar basal body rod protein FlgB [Panacagrimonas sp.]